MGAKRQESALIGRQQLALSRARADRARDAPRASTENAAAEYEARLQKDEAAATQAQEAEAQEVADDTVAELKRLNAKLFGAGGQAGAKLPPLASPAGLGGMGLGGEATPLLPSRKAKK